MGLAAVCSITLCAACAGPAPSQPAGQREAPAEPPREQPAEAPAEAPERQPLTPLEAAQVRLLLTQADIAIADNHLTDPMKGSALALYEEVKTVDPDNEAARRGLERIVERYLELALQAADQGRFGQADVMLDRARQVDAEHPGIPPVHTRVRLLETAERRVIEVDGQQLRDRAPGVKEVLRLAGIASQAQGCQAHITARNDSEGRWMYQRMSEAGSRARIQAQLHIGSPPRIEVLCFPTGE